MKYITLAFAFVLFSACGNGIDTRNSDEEPLTQQTAIPQPFIFQEVSPYLHGMHISLKPLPSGRWLLMTREGFVQLLDNEFQLFSVQPLTVLTISDAGLFSFALDPNYDTNKYIYIYHTLFSDAPPCDEVRCTILIRYTVNEESSPLLSSPVIIATYKMDKLGPGKVGHQGGGMVFGPDGKLYIAIGDGHDAETREEVTAQDPQSQVGKIHRINVNTLESEMVAMGLRNPFTMVSSTIGPLIGDVGLEDWEEINFLPWDSEVVDFGWPSVEGPGPNFTNPILPLEHCDESPKDQDPFGHSPEVEVEGMVIKNHDGVIHYCGNEIVTVAGYYPVRESGDPNPYNGLLDNSVIYSEPYYGWIRAFNLEDGIAVNDRHLAHLLGIVSMVEGPDGYLYAVSMWGSNRILKLIPNPEAQ